MGPGTKIITLEKTIPRKFEAVVGNWCFKNRSISDRDKLLILV